MLQNNSRSQGDFTDLYSCINQADNCLRQWRFAITLWDVSAQLTRTKLSYGHFRCYVLTFSPDGDTLISGSRMRRLFVESDDHAISAQSAVLHGHPAQVQSLAFSHDGKTPRRAALDQSCYGMSLRCCIKSVSSFRGPGFR
jgi:WD40 repeat protein